MNRKFRTIAAAVLLLGLVSLMGGCCKESGLENPVPEEPVPEEKELVFTWDVVLLGKGAEHNLSVYPRGFEEDPNEILQNLVWKSNDTTCAMVNENGRVHALSAGITTINASYGSVTGKCSIRVSDGYDIIVPREITLRVEETKVVNEDDFVSKGGSYSFNFEMSDNSYYASLPLIQAIAGQYQYVGVGSGGGQHSPEYKYGGLTLTGKHEGSTSLRIYNAEIGFDTLVPVIVLPE